MKFVVLSLVLVFASIGSIACQNSPTSPTTREATASAASIANAVPVATALALDHTDWIPDPTDERAEALKQCLTKAAGGGRGPANPAARAQCYRDYGPEGMKLQNWDCSGHWMGCIDSPSGDW